MRSTQISGIAVAAFLTVTSSAFAQTPPAQAQTADTTTTQTFTGCVMTEPDYRRAHNLGSGAAGGVGLGDEFVLVDARVTPAKNTTAMEPASGTAAVVNTAPTSPAGKCADEGAAYRLNGSDEEKIKQFVGRHIEVQGRFKDASDAAMGGTPPAGRLPAEVVIVSFVEAPAPADNGTAATSTPPASTPQTQTAPATPVTTPVEPARDQAAASPERSELPQTASSTGLMALVGVLALCSGLALAVMRRRVA